MDLYKFPSPILFEISGPDAERYLQSRLSNDIKLCSERNMILAAALTAQGKVQAIFRVWRDGSGFKLLSDGGDRSVTEQVLLQFKVSEQVELEDLSDKVSHFYLSSEVSNLDLAFGHHPKVLGEVVKGGAGVICIGTKRLSTDGFDLIAPSSGPESIESLLQDQGGRFISDEEYQVRTIRSGVLLFPDDLVGRLLLEGECRDAVSFKKGCYVGQEVLERIDSQGKIPRILLPAEIKSVQEFSPGEKIKLDGSQSALQVVRSIALPKECSTLLVVSSRNEELDIAGELSYGGSPCRFLARKMSYFLNNQGDYSNSSEL